MVIVLEKLILQKQFVEIVRRFNLKTKTTTFNLQWKVIEAYKKNVGLRLPNTYECKC